MQTLIFFPILLLVLEICVAKKEFNVIRFVNCPEYKNNSIMYKNIFIRRNKAGKSIAVSFDVIFKKEVKRIQILVNSIKCDNSGNLDTCEYYMKDFKMNNVCDMAELPNQILSDFLNNSNLTGRCPIPAGTYRANDLKLDSYVQLYMMSIPKALWKLKLFGYDVGNDNVMVYCSNLEMNVYNSRRNS